MLNVKLIMLNAELVINNSELTTIQHLPYEL